MDEARQVECSGDVDSGTSDCGFPPRVRSGITLLLSLLLLDLVLLFPAHPARFTLETLPRFPLELPAIVLCLLLLKSLMLRWLLRLMLILLMLLLLLRLADLGSYLAFNRRFSPLLEWHLLADGWNLASTSIGPLQASIVVAVVSCLLCLLAAVLFRSLRTIAHSRGRHRLLLRNTALITLLVGLTAWFSFEPVRSSSFLQAGLLPEFRQRVANLIYSIEDQKQFQQELRQDAVLDHGNPSFAALQGRDVILVFVESYGRGYVEAEHFRDAARARLGATESRLTEAGLVSRSGWLTSPIRGGRSWLAHATLNSGLLIDNQARFDRLISSDRQSISRLFSNAGWHTTGVMPAIQFAWPEGQWYGFDSLKVSADMGFAGERFGYVTMPDQYTLSHFEHAVRHEHTEPVMATIALLSTHAPWSPLPLRVDWDRVGDGSLYDGSYRFGEPISWKYRKQVQEMYIRSFDYTLDILGDYAARYADDALIIIVGDHQPPPVINGWGKSGDVPIHLISRDESLLQRLPRQFWSDGMIPDSDILSQPMQSFRQSLAEQFED